MSQSEDALASVFAGIWKDESRSWIHGNILTMTPQTAKILTAILALLVQLAGSQLWHICQVALHQQRATDDMRDPIYWLVQVVLRNVHTALEAFTQFFFISWAWRHQQPARSLSRCRWLIIWPLIHIVIFTLLGIFVSNFLDAGDRVLSRSSHCGTYNETYIESTGDSTTIGMPNQVAVEWRAYLQTRYSRSQHYFERCSSLPSGCDDLPHQLMSWSARREDTCPFSPGLCSSAVKTMRFDTGLLSSNEHFGINSRDSDRVLFRKVTTCTPLNSTRYISDWQNVPATDTSPAKKVVRAHFGPNPLADDNATYVYSNFAQYFAFSQYYDTLPYQINVQRAVTGDTDLALSDFYPITELQRSDADLMLVFLSFNKFYDEPVNDPWFSATEAGPYPLINGSDTINGTIYSREKPVTTLACTEQYQVCNESSRRGENPKCTELTGFIPLVSGPGGVNSLEWNSHQYVSLQRVVQASADSWLSLMLLGLSQRDPPLLARRLILGTVGLGLPDDQWERETEYWHAISMVNMQRAVIEYATGQFVAKTSYVNTTYSPERQWLCNNQIIRGTNYLSFNFVGVMLVISFSVLIIIVGVCIEYMLEWAHVRWRPNSAMSRGWRRTEMLDMLRDILKRTGRGQWSSPSGIPLCSASEKFDINDFGNPYNSELSSLHASFQARESV
jgi:hypothetical protein